MFFFLIQMPSLTGPWSSIIFLPVKLLQQPLELLVVHVLLLRDDLHVHLLLLQLLLVSLQLDQGIFLLSLGKGK